MPGSIPLLFTPIHRSTRRSMRPWRPCLLGIRFTCYLHIRRCWLFASCCTAGAGCRASSGKIDTMDLRIAFLYPELMNIYGDRGNILALSKRAQWRGIDVQVDKVSLGDTIDPDYYDFYF